MSALRKVLIVDDGSRRSGRTLSAELAGLGYASVTAAVEATEDVLAVMGDPAAVVLDMPVSGRADRAAFTALAERLRRGPLGSSVPIIEIDAFLNAGGAPIDLQGRGGACSLNEPEL